MRLILWHFHDFVLRWFWRIIAWKHPRGWLHIHAVIDEGDPKGSEWIHCHGMERWGLHNIEFVDVPQDLAGFTHGILMALTGYMKLTKPINPDESIGGLFCGEDSGPYQEATLRLSPNCGTPDYPASDLLRVVDLNEPASAGFPGRLMAAYLVGSALDERNVEKAERMLRRAIEVYPPSDLQPVPTMDDGVDRHNHNNYFAYWILGDLLCATNRKSEGLEQYNEAARRCPAWVTATRGMLGKEAPVDVDPFVAWLRDVDLPALQQNGGSAPVAAPGDTVDHA